MSHQVCIVYIYIFSFIRYISCFKIIKRPEKGTQKRKYKIDKCKMAKKEKYRNQKVEKYRNREIVKCQY